MSIPTTQTVEAHDIKPGDRFIHVTTVGGRIQRRIAFVISNTPTTIADNTTRWRDITCLSDGHFVEIQCTKMQVRLLT